MEQNKKDLHWFLTKTSAGYMIGGEDAGQRYIESVFDAHGINLRASLAKATGGPEIQFKTKVKADNVVFHAGKKESKLREGLFFSKSSASTARI